MLKREADLIEFYIIKSSKRVISLMSIEAIDGGLVRTVRMMIYLIGI